MAYNRKEEIIENLRDAGCSEVAIDCFLNAFCSGNKKVSAAGLREHRKALLNEMHASQRKIDCLDYFLYLLDKGEVTIDEKTI